MNNPMDGASCADIGMSALESRIDAIEKFLVNHLEDACIDGGRVASKREVEDRLEREKRIREFEERTTPEQSARYARTIIAELSKALREVSMAQPPQEG